PSPNASPLPIAPNSEFRIPNSEFQIHFFACNLATGDAGTEFLTKLHRITGATIHASTTKIGNAQLGGNWELDAVYPAATLHASSLSSQERAEVRLPISQFAAQNYAGVLADPVATDDGSFPVIGNATSNIDVLSNDNDADGDLLTITAIVDTQNSNNNLPITPGASVTLASGTIVELLPNGTLNVTTT
ncbi:MAG: DUF4347 domain-containing protein, partial [Cyanobacteria bacterium J06639_14]